MPKENFKLTTAKEFIEEMDARTHNKWVRILAGDSVKGNWYFNQNQLTLDLKKQDLGKIYEVDLERMWNSPSILDWVAQVSHRVDVTSKDVGDLIRALDFMLNLQGNYCGCATDKETHIIEAMYDQGCPHFDTYFSKRKSSSA